MESKQFIGYIMMLYGVAILSVMTMIILIEAIEILLNHTHEYTFTSFTILIGFSMLVIGRKLTDS